MSRVLETTITIYDELTDYSKDLTVYVYYDYRAEKESADPYQPDDPEEVETEDFSCDLRERTCRADRNFVEAFSEALSNLLEADPDFREALEQAAIKDATKPEATEDE